MPEYELISPILIVSCALAMPGTSPAAASAVVAASTKRLFSVIAVLLLLLPDDTFPFIPPPQPAALRELDVRRCAGCAAGRCRWQGAPRRARQLPLRPAAR